MIEKFNTKELINDLHTFRSARPFLSFAISSLRMSQVALELLQSINNYSQNNYDLDFYIYNINPDDPITKPFCAIYNRTELLSHKGPIIALDPFACHSLLANKFAKIYYYIYDPMLIFMIDPKIRNDIISNPNIRFIARNKQQRQLITQGTSVFCNKKLIHEINEETLKDFAELING